jgi:hypothetical protein
MPIPQLRRQEMTDTTQKSATKHPRRMAREPKPQQDAHADDEASGAATGEQAKLGPTRKGSSKNEAVLALLKRPEGATLDQMVEATGWLPHTTRAVLTGFKKKGHSITSEKVDGVRVYRVSSAAGSV